MTGDDDDEAWIRWSLMGGGWSGGGEADDLRLIPIMSFPARGIDEDDSDRSNLDQPVQVGGSRRARRICCIRI